MRSRTVLTAVSAAVLAIGSVSTTPALAAGETFGCHVAPNADQTYRAGCGPDRPASSNIVSFQFTGTGTYSYSWSLSGDLSGSAIVTGCTATTSLCNIRVGTAIDRVITGQVTATQDGVAITDTATARTLAVCGSVWC